MPVGLMQTDAPEHLTGRRNSSSITIGLIQELLQETRNRRKSCITSCISISLILELILELIHACISSSISDSLIHKLIQSRDFCIGVCNSTLLILELFD